MPTSALLYQHADGASRRGGAGHRCILAAAAAMWLTPGTAPILRRWSAIWVGLVFVQFLLGACTIWTNKAADVATTHVAVGRADPGARRAAHRHELAFAIAGELAKKALRELRLRAPLDRAARGIPPRDGHAGVDSLASDLSELTKARLTVMVLLTTLAGYCLANRRRVRLADALPHAARHGAGRDLLLDSQPGAWSATPTR